MANDDSRGGYSRSNFHANRAALMATLLYWCSGVGVCLGALYHVGGTMSDIGILIVPAALGLAFPIVQFFAPPQSPPLASGRAMAFTYGGLTGFGLLGGFKGGGPFFEVVGVSVVFAAVPMPLIFAVEWLLRSRKRRREAGLDPQGDPTLTSGV